MIVTDANIAWAKTAIAEEQYTPQDSLSLVWKTVNYLHEANYMVDLLNKTAADFSSKYNPAGKLANPFRVSIRVGSGINATNVLGEHSFEIEVQELHWTAASGREYPMLDDALDQVFLASAPRSQQHSSNLPELVTYEVRHCTRNVGLN